MSFNINRRVASEMADFSFASEAREKHVISRRCNEISSSDSINWLDYPDNRVQVVPSHQDETNGSLLTGE